MNQELLNQIVSIIDNVNDMTIATVRSDGFPQATTVSYMNDSLNIYFMAGADSQKAENIERNNKVSLTINREYDNWNEIEGLSMGALAHRVADPVEMEKIGQLLLKKFPEAAEFENSVDINNVAFFRLEPVVISLLDYSKGFGHCQLLDVSDVSIV